MITIIQGGNQHTIPHNRPTLGKKEEETALQVLRSGWVAQGKAVAAFENEMCHFLGLQEGCAVAVSSGSAALYLALWALGADGKKIAYPSHSCTALRNATFLVGGESVVVDSLNTSPNMDLEKLSNEKIDIAVIPHMYGLPIDLSTIPSSIKVIEDCAQALGAAVNGVAAGIQGDIGVFSFYATKLITSGGQGGMIVSKDSSITELIRDFLKFDQRADSKIRFNFQMTDLQAAIGHVQLKQFPRFLIRRQEIFQQYTSANLPLLQSEYPSQQVHFRALLETSKQGELINALEKQFISAAIPLKDEHLLGSPSSYPNAYRWTQQLVSLPIYPTLSDQDIHRIINAVKAFN